MTNASVPHSDRLLTNVIWFPSGDHEGNRSSHSSSGRMFTLFDPSGFIVHKSHSLLPSLGWLMKPITVPSGRYEAKWLMVAYGGSSSAVRTISSVPSGLVDTIS